MGALRRRFEQRRLCRQLAGHPVFAGRPGHGRLAGAGPGQRRRLQRRGGLARRLAQHAVPGQRRGKGAQRPARLCRAPAARAPQGRAPGDCRATPHRPGERRGPENRLHRLSDRSRGRTARRGSPRRRESRPRKAPADAAPGALGQRLAGRPLPPAAARRAARAHRAPFHRLGSGGDLSPSTDPGWGGAGGRQRTGRTPALRAGRYRLRTA